ncbi:MAG: molybdopterin-dependent oxidoreductase [Chromatiaceae bacterium]
MKRREFLKWSGVLGGAAVLPPALLSGCSPFPSPPGSGKVTVTPTVCEICFWKCAGFVHKEDGKSWKVVGNPEDLHSHGRLCTRGTGGVGAYLDPDRLKRPLLRVERNGKQTFKEVSWDEVLDHTADRLKRIAKEHGPETLAVFSQSCGAEHFRTLARAYGTGSFAAPDYAQCRAAREVGFFLTYGETIGGQERTDMANSRCIVLIGTHIGENLHNDQVHTFSEAVANGATIITVDPRFSVAASKSKYWLPIRPGTDLALLLAWMNVLIGEKLYDQDYIERYAIGLDELAKHVATYTPEWAYLETGIEPETIRRTAREMAAQAPATLVHPGRHVAWYGDDTQRVRAVAILNALLGSWGRKGGLYIPERVDLPEYPLPDFPEPKTTWRDAHGGKYPFAYGGVTNELIAQSSGPNARYKAWLVYEANLPVSVPAVAEQIRRAAADLDLLVVVDTMPMEVTGYADVVLPECTYLERHDPVRNEPQHHSSLAVRMPAFEPQYDSKPGWWIARELGLRLGLEKYFPWKEYREVMDWQLKQVGSSMDEMERIELKNFPRRDPEYIAPGEAYTFPTPSGKIELYSHQLEEHGFDPMPRYTAHEGPPAGFYRLIYGRMPAHTFSRTTNNPLLFQIMPENTVWVNPLTAADWKLDNGGHVRLKNQDGVLSNRVRVRVTERIGPDAVYLVHGFGHRDRRLRLADGVGASDTVLITRIRMDPIMGATGMRSNFVTFVAEEV